MSQPGRDERRPSDKDAAQCRESAKTADTSSLHPAADNCLPLGHPLPEVSRRPALPAEVPPAAARLAEAAEAGAWIVELSYARGAQLDRYGRPGKVADSLAVRLSRGDDRAVATFLDGSFKTGWAWATEPVTIPIAVKYRPLLVRIAEAVRDD